MFFHSPSPARALRFLHALGLEHPRFQGRDLEELADFGEVAAIVSAELGAIQGAEGRLRKRRKVVGGDFCSSRSDGVRRANPSLYGSL
jgi:hypothetical protein